jgi:hypothetical protein
MSEWPDIITGRKYIGNGGGIRGHICIALRQDVTSFGHKHAYVIWTNEAPEGINADENNGSLIRTSLLTLVKE